MPQERDSERADVAESQGGGSLASSARNFPATPGESASSPQTHPEGDATGLGQTPWIDSANNPAEKGFDASVTVAAKNPEVPDPSAPASDPSPLSREDADEPTVISRRPVESAEPSHAGIDSAIRSPQQLIGAVLDHYRLDDFIGGGGMGAVYRAYDALLRRTVAVKILSRGSADPDLLRRFVNEARSAAKLDHENIARVFFVGQDQGFNYIVFEYIEGKNIRQIVSEQGSLPLPLAMRYMCQLARALEHASARQVIHRDIKPSNVVVTPDHRAKLVDMGLARIHHLDERQAELTASDMTLGTFDYISPEQARDPRSADTRSDLYSLGCTFYFMLTGLPPFPDGTALQKVLAHREARRPDPRDHRPDIPESIVRIIRKAIDTEPNRRYQSANELLADLLFAAAALKIDVGIGESYVIETTTIRRDAFDRFAPWIISGIALAAVMLTYEWWSPVSSSWQEPPPSYQQTNRSAPATSTTDATASGQSTAPKVRPIDPTNTESNPASPTAPTITSLRIGGPEMSIAGSERVASWDEAIRRAGNSSEIREIQLWAATPIDVTPTSIESRSLRIVAGPGIRPTLRYRAVPGGVATPHLFRLFGDEFSLRGVDVEITVEAGANPPTSIFRIEQDYASRLATGADPPLQEFDFVDCRFTLQVPPLGSSTVMPMSVPTDTTPPVVLPLSGTAIQIPSVNPGVERRSAATTLVDIRRPESFFLRLSNVDLAQYPNVRFRRTLTRGPWHLLTAIPATPFGLQWEQSAFASSELAIVLGGVRDDALLPDESLRADLELREVTILAKGLIESRADSMAPVDLPLTLRTDRCWFLPIGNEPWVRHRSQRSNTSPLQWRGRDNAIERNATIWLREVGGQPDRRVVAQDLPAGRALTELTDSLLLDSLPRSLRTFLEGTTRWERFNAELLSSSLSELSNGSSRRLGVQPLELPGAATIMPTLSPMTSAETTRP